MDKKKTHSWSKFRGVRLFRPSPLDPPLHFCTLGAPLQHLYSLNLINMSMVQMINIYIEVQICTFVFANGMQKLSTFYCSVGPINVNA